MNKPSREDIILLAKEAAEGNRTAVDQLARLHLPRIEHEAREIADRASQVPDLIGIGQLAYVETLPKLKMEKLTKRSPDPVWAYVAVGIRRKMRSQLWELDAPLHVPHRTRHRAWEGNRDTDTVATEGATLVVALLTLTDHPAPNVSELAFRSSPDRFASMGGATSLPVARALTVRAVPLDLARPVDEDDALGLADDYDPARSVDVEDDALDLVDGYDLDTWDDRW